MSVASTGHQMSEEKTAAKGQLHPRMISAPKSIEELAVPTTKEPVK